MKLSIKLISVFISLALIIILVSSLIFFIIGKSSIEDRVRSQLESIAVLKANQVESFIIEEKYHLEELSQDETLLNLFYAMNNFHEVSNSNDMIAHHKLQDYLIKTLNSPSQNFFELFILNEKGIAHMSTDKKQEGKIKSNEIYFKRGLTESYIQPFYYDLSLNLPSMTVSTPIKDENGIVKGVLVGRVNLKVISSILTERSGMGDTGETYLVNKFNYMLTESRFKDDMALKGAIYNSGVEDCLDGKESSLKYIGYRNIEVIDYHIWIPEREICLLAAIDTEEALQPVNDLMKATVFVSLLITIFASIFAFLFSKTITSPLGEIVKGTEEFAKENLNYKIKVKSKDELGELSTAFNKMSDELKTSNNKIKNHEKELESEVESRTKELKIKIEQLEKFSNLTVGREMKMVELKKQVKELELKLEKKK